MIHVSMTLSDLPFLVNKDFQIFITHISRSRYYSTPNNSEMVQDRAIVTMADQYKIVLWSIKRHNFNDLERPPQFSRSHHYLTPDI